MSLHQSEIPKQVCKLPWSLSTFLRFVVDFTLWNDKRYHVDKCKQQNFFFLHQQERPPFSLKSILEPLKSIGPLFNLTRGCFLFHPLAQHLHFNDTFHPWGLVGMVSWVCSYWRRVHTSILAYHFRGSISSVKKPRLLFFLLFHVNRKCFENTEQSSFWDFVLLVMFDQKKLGICLPRKKMGPPLMIVFFFYGASFAKYVMMNCMHKTKDRWDTL